MPAEATKRRRESAGGEAVEGRLQPTAAPRARIPVPPLAGLVLTTALLFGGGARQGLIGDAIPELAALPLLAIALPPAWPRLRRSPAALALACGLVVLPCLQLIALPPDLWSALPGRTIVVDVDAGVGVPLGWRPISMLPAMTWRALLSLLPTLAMFIAVLNLDRRSRNALSLLAAAIGAASAFVALLQAAGGEESALYFYALTNVGKGVGFFANANHFGALEAVLLPLAAAARGGRRRPSPAILIAVFCFIAPALLLGLSLSGSRAAIVLGALSLAATLILPPAPELARWGRARLLAFAAASLVLALMLGLETPAALSRFSNADFAGDSRWTIAASAWAGIVGFFPFGAGVGTFPSLYPVHERLADLMPQFVNRAHDDALEILFEGGAASAILALGLVIWLGLATRRALAGDDRLARAGVVAMWLLLLQSLWDYPLRTIALGTIFGLCAALQFAPPPARRTEARAVGVDRVVGTS